MQPCPCQRFMFQETGCGRWRVTCASDSRGHLYPAQAAPPQPRCRASKGRVGTGCNRSPAMSQQSLRGQPAPQNLSELKHPALCQQSRKPFFSIHPRGYPARTSPSIQARRAEPGGQRCSPGQGVGSLMPWFLKGV